MKSIEKKVLSVSDYYIYTPSKTAERIFLYPLQCGIFSYEAGYKLWRNSFDSFLLMYIQQGTMILDFGGSTREVKQGNFVLIDCYKPHGYSTEVGYECLWMHFDGEHARDYYNLITERLGNVFAMPDVFPVLRKLTTIFDVFYKNTTVHEPLLSKYITDILTEFMIYNPIEGQARDYTGMTEQVVTYINEHYSEDISIEQLASISGLSSCYFIRVFKQETGYTPHEYLVNCRMASARYLLKCTTLTVKEICYNVGFSDTSVFCNAFKRCNKMSPVKYRESFSAPA